jgi:hypothetical protein
LFNVLKLRTSYKASTQNSLGINPGRQTEVVEVFENFKNPEMSKSKVPKHQKTTNTEQVQTQTNKSHKNPNN